MKNMLEEYYNKLEKLLRLADEDLEAAKGQEKQQARKRRNAINAACNALYRARRG